MRHHLSPGGLVRRPDPEFDRVAANKASNCFRDTPLVPRLRLLASALRTPQDRISSCHISNLAIAATIPRDVSTHGPVVHKFRRSPLLRAFDPASWIIGWPLLAVASEGRQGRSGECRTPVPGLVRPPPSSTEPVHPVPTVHTRPTAVRCQDVNAATLRHTPTKESATDHIVQRVAHRNSNNPSQSTATGHSPGLPSEASSLYGQRHACYQ